MSTRKKSIKRVVIKIGSNVLTNHHGIRKNFMNDLAGEVLFLRKRGIDSILVSSGAIASAMALFKKDAKPATIPQKQAYAAIGQPLLMDHYGRVFRRKKLKVAQLLLTRDGVENQAMLLNAKHALNELLAEGVVPIINENDTVAVDEIKIGDNDQLSAHVACLVGADLLVILSHVAGLCDKDPDKFRDAQIIPVVQKITPKIQSMIFTSHNERSVGGMATKFLAVKMCLAKKIPVVITSGFQKNFIRNIFSEKFVGTLFGSGSL